VVMDDRAETRHPGMPARLSSSNVFLPFCGHEYPPLKGSPGAVICTKPCHPETEMHMNGETGWLWPDE
ncbi:MAG: hypothetical protein QOG05_1857, partial [Streptosporangiaceae bacterium]|nr:hypothetical protein [Streptosporangiaceae bacterium]